MKELYLIKTYHASSLAKKKKNAKLGSLKAIELSVNCNPFS